MFFHVKARIDFASISKQIYILNLEQRSNQKQATYFAFKNVIIQTSFRVIEASNTKRMTP